MYSTKTYKFSLINYTQLNNIYIYIYNIYVHIIISRFVIHSICMYIYMWIYICVYVGHSNYIFHLINLLWLLWKGLYYNNNYLLVFNHYIFI